MTTTMTTYGLLGKSLSHSFSKKYFTDKFSKLGLPDHEYVNLEIESIDKFPSVLEKIALSGFNVTIPYKESIIPYLDELDETAREIGAVNTVLVEDREGVKFLKGYNTDAYGFHQMIKPFLQSQHEHALVLGKGGASKAIAYVLNQYGIDVRFVSRNQAENDTLNWEQINDNVLKHYLLIVNTTPLGMYPDVNDFPQINYKAITNKHLLVDLIYNPEETLFMQKGREEGAVALNGLTMLQQQAERSWEIWQRSK